MCAFRNGRNTIIRNGRRHEFRNNGSLIIRHRRNSILRLSRIGHKGRGRSGEGREFLRKRAERGYRTVQGSEKMQPEQGGADLQHGTVGQRNVCRMGSTGDGDAVDLYFTARARTNQEAGSVLPGKIQVLCMHARAGNHQITGSDRAEHPFAGNRKPGVCIQVTASGKDDQFADRSASGQVMNFFPADAGFGKNEEKHQKYQRNGQNGEKVAGNRIKDFPDVRRRNGHTPHLPGAQSEPKASIRVFIFCSMTVS